jgi:hypothetical protein
MKFAAKSMLFLIALASTLACAKTLHLRDIIRAVEGSPPARTKAVRSEIVQNVNCSGAPRDSPVPTQCVVRSQV